MHPEITVNYSSVSSIKYNSKYITVLTDDGSLQINEWK